jgi:hypothetical protein
MCDEDGYDLDPRTPPPPRDDCFSDDYSPFTDEDEFRFADWSYRKSKLSARSFNELADILRSMHGTTPFGDVKDLYTVIDEIKEGDAPWDSFVDQWDGEVMENMAQWKKNYEVWFRGPLQVMENQISSPDFDGELDYAPKQLWNKAGKRIYTDLMSGNWAWRQAVRRDRAM